MKLRHEEGDHNAKRIWLEDVVINGQNVDIDISEIVCLATWAEVDNAEFLPDVHKL